MSLTDALISLIRMAPRAIEMLLNKLLGDNNTYENQRLANENKQLREQLKNNLSEQKQRNNTAANQREHTGNAQKVTSDPRTTQIQQFLEPMETSEEGLKEEYYASSNQNQPLFEEMNTQSKKTEKNNNTPVIQNQILMHSQTTDKNVGTVNAELETENIELENQLKYYQEQQEQELKEMEKLLEELKQKKLNTFEDIEKQDQQAKETLIRLAKQAKAFGMEGINIAFLGLTATGKSTILNQLFGEKVAQTGIGETTITVKSYQTKDFTLWDIPGKNDEVSYMNMQYISFYKGLTRRLILVQNTLKENSSMMKFFDAIGLDYDVVVNKMDQYADNQERLEFCENIKREPEAIGLKGVGRIFFVSAKFPGQFPDWVEMVNYLTTPR